MKVTVEIADKILRKKPVEAKLLNMRRSLSPHLKEEKLETQRIRNEKGKKHSDRRLKDGQLFSFSTYQYLISESQFS
jgi:hypothetical protein